ncbi:serine/threonine-protein kinase [Streptomyces sp. NPDC002265]|uniref:WD40 repeat domain-containing serine/threonine protein kinase n=1 Tax=Streptomyces sp. NPDC002265 TaxID=3154415 RepID=UPI003319985E
MSRHNLMPTDPQRLGAYWTAARLGSGGQGVVYEAYDAAGRRVAVKVLHWDAASGPAARRRFAKEVTASQRVASFCTARVLEADPDAERPYIVSEFVAGPDLRGAVRDSGPLQGDDLVRLATGVVTALAAIHRAGVVHRDLKPGNVLLGPDGPRVIDFGIARTPEMTLTETGQVMGTFGYIAPETLRGLRADTAADVFAWGAVVLFAATGREPFRGANLGEVVVRALEHQPDLSVLPEPLRSLVREALAKRPEDRPTAAAVLLRLLGGGYDDQQALRAGAGAAALVRGFGEAARATVPSLGAAAAAAYDGLPPAVRATAREVWLRLVVPGTAPDGSHDTVRAADEDELLSERSSGEQAAVRETIAAFADAGVLLHEAATVRPAAAAVLRAWPRLREWVAADREGLRLHRRLGDAARAWDRHRRRPDDLARGTALRNALDWAATAPGWLRPNPLESRFLVASRSADARRLRRRRTTLLASGCLLVVLALVFAALWQKSADEERLADRQHRAATAKGLVFRAGSLQESDLTTALRLGVAAQTLDPTPESRSGLVDALMQRHDALYLDGHTGSVTPARPARRSDTVDEVAFGADGRTVATGGTDGSFVLWDVGNRVRPVRISRTDAKSGGIRALSFGPDGRLLATGGDDGDVRLWDIRHPATPHRLATLPGHGRVESVAVSPDGRTLLAGTNGRYARLWDIGDPADPQPLGRLEGGGDGPVHGVAYSADGRHVVVDGEGDAPYVYDVSQPERPLRQGFLPGNVFAAVLSVAFAPDGHTVATAYDNGDVMLWDLRRALDMSDQSSLASITVHSGPVRDVAFSHDGETLATAGRDGLVCLWDVTRPAEPQRVVTFTGHGAGVSSVDFSPDDQTVVTGGDGGVAALWDGTPRITGHATTVLAQPRGEVKTIVFGSSGQTLALLHQDDAPTAELRDVSVPARPRHLADLAVGTPWIVSAARSPDGRLLALGTGDRATQLWDTSDPTRPVRLARLTGLKGVVSSVAFQPHGHVLATATGEGTEGDRSAELWDIADPRAPRRLAILPDSLVNSLTFTPDGHALVLTDFTEAFLWDVSSAGHPRRLAAFDGDPESMQGSAVSPDGRTVAVAESAKQRVVLYDIADRARPRRLATLPSTTASGTSALAFSPTDAMLATGDGEGAVVLWDTTERTAPRRLTKLSGIRSMVTALAFAPDGRRLAGTEWGAEVSAGRGVVWDVSRIAAIVTHPAERACDLAGRGLDAQEWSRYTDGLPFRNTCARR